MERGTRFVINNFYVYELGNPTPVMKYTGVVGAKKMREFLREIKDFRKSPRIFKQALLYAANP